MEHKTLAVQGLEATIAYLYLLSFCPPERVLEFKQAGALLRRAIAEGEGLSPEEYFAAAVPEACRRIVAFHQDTRNPDEQLVADLAAAARLAHTSPAAAANFSTRMTRLAALPGRSKPDRRPRAGQGCRFCEAACRYGYFALVSRPDHDRLKGLLEAEQHRPEADRDPVRPAWAFATGHLWETLRIEQGYITADHLGNLAYCLLTLGTSKSRYPLPEDAYRDFQTANQSLIEGWEGGRRD